MARRRGFVFIDSGPFVIDLAFPKDSRAGINGTFLRAVKASGQGVISWSVALEVAGALSFHSSAETTSRLARRLAHIYGVVPWPSSFDPIGVDFAQVSERVSRRMKLGDALILHAAETCTPRVATLVTWNAKDFSGRTRLQIQTPQDFHRGR
jgi:predicted nucleic acid-binding protein